MRFVYREAAYELEPLGHSGDGPELWREYMRAEIPPLFGQEFSRSKWEQGFVALEKDLFLLVSLDKGGLRESHQYDDRFLSPDSFQWVSQNRQRQDTPAGRKIREHQTLGVRVHLFVRQERKKPDGTAAPFFYCGQLDFVEWEGEQPITVRWRLKEALPPQLAQRFSAEPSS